jgi:hypothetical protein
MYTIVFNDVAVTAIQDLFEALAPADAAMILHKLEISQRTEVGDAQAEMLDISVRRVTGAPTSGSGGTAPTPAPGPGDSAAGITAEVNNTTQLTGGTNTILAKKEFHVASGLEWLLTPEERALYTFSPSTRLLVELETAPADSITMSGTMLVEEVGG